MRQRLRCAAVCRAWRAALEAPPAPDTASVWRCVDLSAAAVSPPVAADALLLLQLLPRREAYVEELCLRGSDVSLDSVLQSLAAFPRLRLLDLRDCQRMRHRFDVSGEAVLFILAENLERKRMCLDSQPSQTFILLLDGGVLDCSPISGTQHIDAMRANMRKAAGLLMKLQHSTLHGHSAVPADGRRLWLRTDVAVCPYAALSSSCSTFFVQKQPPPGVPPPPLERVTGFTCANCGIVACLVRAVCSVRCVSNLTRLSP